MGNEEGGCTLLSAVKIITLKDIPVDLTCSSDEGRKKCIQNFGRKHNGTIQLGTLKKIILNWALEKCVSKLN
jgi:hypothetical protein